MITEVKLNQFTRELQRIEAGQRWLLLAADARALTNDPEELVDEATLRGLDVTRTREGDFIFQRPQ